MIERHSLDTENVRQEFATVAPALFVASAVWGIFSVAAAFNAGPEVPAAAATLAAVQAAPESAER